MSHRVHPILIGLALVVSASTAPAQIFSGVDVGGGAGGPRVNSDAAHAAWAAAAAPLCPVTETFEGIALLSASPIPLACGMVLNSTGPVGAGFDLNQVTNNQDSEIGYNTTAGGAQFFRFSPDFAVPATLTINFGGPTRAFGVYITGVQQWAGLTNASWGVDNFILPDTDVGQAIGGVQFFGFVSNAPVLSVSFTTRPIGGSRDILGFDDIQVAATIPEPATVALTLTGLLALAGVAIRRRHL
jgi:hypothetical protein